MLRTGLGGRFVVADRAAVRLEAEGVWVDRLEFRRLLGEREAHGHSPRKVCPACVERLSRAMDLWGGDFLAGFSLRDSPEFDDWQFYQAETVRREVASALEGLAEGHAAAGRLEEALGAARRWLALDPLQEEAHRRLMRLQAAAGDRSAALRQYRECVRVLDRELSVAPLEETTALYHAIERGEVPAEVPAVRAAAVPSPVPARSAYPMVGRAGEWEGLVAAYRAAATGGGFAVVEGEAGIGKTRLAEELASWAAGRGAAAVAVRCHQGESGIPYGAVVDALRGALARDREWVGRVSAEALSEAARLVPGLGPAGEAPAEGDAARRRLLEGAASAMAASVAGDPPGILVLDDLQWADEGSVDCIAYLLRRLPDAPILVLATWRSEEVPPGHRLRQIAAAARRAGSGTTVVLGRLAPGDVEELVSAAAVPGEAAGRLFRETEGLPFFLIEYLGAMAGGTIDSGGEWTVPGGVDDLVRSRIRGASETPRQALSAAAVIGRGFDSNLLRLVSGRSEEETVAALEELEGRGLVRALAEGVYDFTHERIRDVAYGETSLARWRALHRRAAEALGPRARGRREEAALAAHHFRLAGDDDRAAEQFRLAARHARSVHANAEALEHVRTALALGHPGAAALHEAAGDLLALRGDYRETVTAYEAAAALSGAGDLARLEHRLAGVHQRRGAWDLAESHLAAAADLLGEGRTAEAARIHADRSLTAYRRNDRAQASEHARRALEAAAEARDPDALARAHNVLGILSGAAGDLQPAREHLERSLAIAGAVADPAARIAALNNLARLSRREGDLERAVELTVQALEACARIGDRHREAALRNNLADLLRGAGRTEEAMAELKRAVAIFAEVGEEPRAEPEIWKLEEW